MLEILGEMMADASSTVAAGKQVHEVTLAIVDDVVGFIATHGVLAHSLDYMLREMD